ncbi:MAG: hypothetical protein A2W93_16215 [Bacteroidetes bacterium GWF2_43_63]|nr:MAG: hypothetical protein A2W94_11210 [Bacteroidetes bacterium GWE2_42_42]OFY54267.1 MAG: hypothetical protein A2W93_16215 [Bacteroidetes bacterium GWF2_43_63]HBG69338.1 hypothetical protein [Bacteroidales bacterium]HCB60391.1 hypothetical protein [Bacteroidales bacterium]HCY23622.1 hypothetical protein [Bacteroidales bacterium]
MRNIKSFVRTGKAAGAPTVSFLVRCEAGGDTFFSSFHFEKNTQNDSGGAHDESGTHYGSVVQNNELRLIKQ